MLGRVLGTGWSAANASAVERTTRKPNTARWLLPVLASAVGLAALTAFGLLQGSILADQHALGAHGLLATAVAHLLVLMITVMLLSLGMSNKDLNQLDEDMEWLLALPASIPVLYIMKVGERTLSNGYAWLLIYPWVVGMVSRGHWSWSTPLVAILVCLPLFLLLALYYVVLESAARRWLPRALINNLQLAGTLGGFGLALAVLRSPGRMASVRRTASVNGNGAHGPAVGLIACAYAGLVIAYGLTRQLVSYAVLGGAGYCLVGVTLVSLLSAAFAAYCHTPLLPAEARIVEECLRRDDPKPRASTEPARLRPRPAHGGGFDEDLRGSGERESQGPTRGHEHVAGQDDGARGERSARIASRRQALRGRACAPDHARSPNAPQAGTDPWSRPTALRDRAARSARPRRRANSRAEAPPLDVPQDDAPGHAPHAVSGEDVQRGIDVA